MVFKAFIGIVEKLDNGRGMAPFNLAEILYLHRLHPNFMHETILTLCHRNENSKSEYAYFEYIRIKILNSI